MNICLRASGLTVRLGDECELEMSVNRTDLPRLACYHVSNPQGVGFGPPSSLASFLKRQSDLTLSSNFRVIRCNKYICRLGIDFLKDGRILKQ